MRGNQMKTLVEVSLATFGTTLRNLAVGSKVLCVNAAGNILVSTNLDSKERRVFSFITLMPGSVVPENYEFIGIKDGKTLVFMEVV